MNSKTTKRFRQMFAECPKEVRKQAREAYRLFVRNPNHPSLRFKKVHTHEPIYSARINIDYRAVAVLEGNDLVWFWLGPHSEYEKILNHL